ncbi:tRNA (adenosine(37)-N6)-dimethylallyltransferase MiaA [Helicobacter aurati]|uniref:tRNA dimethylallyltransferase n=1 Tax=Helicobacter aurati TaxID=137778 RepID=A0A3D8J865_9HELI|nr:tRNA (adenosine(37)-N6)-dimethylallyltransferase MiaA [Helicobacter aurati]RDU73703.1 tRNA (adenosine(37)-N6)-dimethylallyltransferase MiaA [Helicobacter aurati]
MKLHSHIPSNNLSSSTKQYPKIIAIIGATCSGKSSLAIQIAEKINASIFSLDSLSIYKEIYIASAKPKEEERKHIKHFALDILKPDSKVNVGIFLDLLYEAVESCKQDDKTLLIVGGSSFYLKSIINGLSPKPHGDSSGNALLNELSTQSLAEQYRFLCTIDSEYARKIQRTDSYRISRALEIFALSRQCPSDFFANNPPKPFPLPITCYQLLINKALLHKRIEARTSAMLQEGIIDEAQMLINSYGIDIQPFKSIGLKECLAFLQGKINKQELEALINIHTKQLAKRQKTFNKTQFQYIYEGDSQSIIESLE